MSRVAPAGLDVPPGGRLAPPPERLPAASSPVPVFRSAASRGRPRPSLAEPARGRRRVPGRAGPAGALPAQLCAAASRDRATRNTRVALRGAGGLRPPLDAGPLGRGFLPVALTHHTPPKPTGSPGPSAPWGACPPLRPSTPRPQHPDPTCPFRALSKARVRPSSGHWWSLWTISQDNVPSEATVSPAPQALWVQQVRGGGPSEGWAGSRPGAVANKPEAGLSRARPAQPPGPGGRSAS